MKNSERHLLPKILADPIKRRELMVRSIIAAQAREGIVTTREQAERAYDNVQHDRETIRPAIPGVTPGAGKCRICGQPVSWSVSRMCFDANGQEGVLRTFYCNAHKPA